MSTPRKPRQSAFIRARHARLQIVREGSPGQIQAHFDDLHAKGHLIDRPEEEDDTAEMGDCGDSGEGGDDD